MTQNKSKQLPAFTSNQELIDFFEPHDMGEYESELLKVHFDVEIKSTQYLVSLEKALLDAEIDLHLDL